MRVLNKKYWPYSVKLHKHLECRYATDEDPRKLWCMKNLHPNNWHCYGFNQPIFGFKKQEDMVLFSLYFL